MAALVANPQEKAHIRGLGEYLDDRVIRTILSDLTSLITTDAAVRAVVTKGERIPSVFTPRRPFTSMTGTIRSFPVGTAVRTGEDSPLDLAELGFLHHSAGDVRPGRRAGVSGAFV